MSCFATPLNWRLFRGAPVLNVLLGILLAIPALPIFAQAQDALPPLTLQQAVSRTLERHPALAVFEYRHQSLDGRAQTANLRPALNLDAELENFAGTDGTENTEFTVGLSSVIELGGKRDARGQVIVSERRLLNIDREIQALDLLGEVTRRYVQVLSTTEQVALAGDAVHLAEDAVASVRARISAGAAPGVEQLRAEAALSRAQLQHRQLQKQLQAERVALAAMWGETRADFSVPTGQLYRLQAVDDFSTYFARAQQNPLLMRYASEARVQDAQLRLARTAARADLGWGLGVRQSNETDSTSLVAGVSLPLFSGRRAQGEIARNRAALEGIALREESARLQLHTQLYRAYSDRAQAVHAVQRLRADIIPTLARAMSETEALYRAGRYSYQEWVAAREELLDARSALIQSATRALLAEAEMEQLTAEPLAPHNTLQASEK
ncbi:TolC family protein [uncultured Microbulbifer sp.]|uniref:TolC family protein n=1 Tax=uncultured Microbulbifer sp. TaxID=348147 RepID=UPI00262BF590|nr:TolC family protein [uncultured Microbulbifer sp.]